MKRQRSKAELLLQMRAYQALKKDERNGTGLSKKTVYWRMGVEWSVVLWKDENFSTNEIAKFLQYIVEHDVTELSEVRRQEIRELLNIKVDWTLRNSLHKKKERNAVDQAVHDLGMHNTQVSVDYSLLACEYLMTHKGYAKKRLDRVIGDVYYLDNQTADIIWQARQELYDKKGIWIELGNDEKPEGAQII